MLTANEIRSQFLDFFKSKGHEIVPSAPIVVKNDPTLLFTNAGMNQFKDFFLGNGTPSNTRIADTQKCLRVSGKHNDLEEVGVDTYHHTMFEMLGNWSFGDYFKKEAIEWSWELLTEVYKIPKDKLYVTVFQGDAAENLPMDEEAYNYWKQYVAEDRILMGNKKDNFWEMGDTGPCGPCSEIHVDCRTEEEKALVPGAKLVNADHPQVIEIWNNVFMQFNRQKDGSLVTLPAQHVDTGMGLERLVRVLQGKQSNYDTDLFTGTIAAIEQMTGKKYGYTDSKQDVAFRVLSDHIRAIGFTIADGQLPSNTGAGYVIRRILRRAVRYYYSYLDFKHPLLYKLMAVLAKQFEDVFPELHKQLDLVTKVVKEEEDAFLRTLEKGLRRMDTLMADKNTSGTVIGGEKAFELHDTYGFPIDLTVLIAGEKGYAVDQPGFEEELKKQKTRSRAATALDTHDWIVVRDAATVNFVGYTDLEAEGNVLKYRKVTSKGKDLYQFVLDTTPFYAESGGQVGDTGEFVFPNESIQIIDTKKEDGLTIHFSEVLPDSVTGPVLAKVDAGKRANTEVHHSGTHLLHAALREVLGTHVAQKGSLVNDNNLRFDFSHFAKVTDEEVAQIEKIVNTKIRENVPVAIKEMTKDEAIAMGAMALFGEKYGNTVRVVVMDPNYSIELCGGTHVGSTGQLGFFKIISEGAVAAGVRRMEAVSGVAAERFMNEQLALLDSIGAQLKNNKDPLKAIEKLQEEKVKLEAHIEHLEARQLVGVRNELLTKDEIINEITFVGQIVNVSSADALKKLCLDLKNHLNDLVVVLCANIDGKPFVAVGVDEKVNAARGLDASKIIKENVAALIKGGGGGQKTLATAGGQDITNLQQVIDNVRAIL
ncbi:alanine--tRNA ligase [Flavipsychrobacter stenotrophus]|uniref:Alanine--tRNA ligase n=1 Tax=Flavipsychrobacter stenotrophus TaxID=2077091 RepID=A0A2S7SYP4_9BACT|nr:alanine--tRNA ligase [Flavipsychrobacter stenotrophus]PQJ12042.1 alanine--tRNA ligase [Flavipsychrobacter stenotrophus]